MKIFSKVQEHFQTRWQETAEDRRFLVDVSRNLLTGRIEATAAVVLLLSSSSSFAAVSAVTDPAALVSSVLEWFGHSENVMLAVLGGVSTVAFIGILIKIFA